MFPQVLHSWELFTAAHPVGLQHLGDCDWLEEGASLGSLWCLTSRWRHNLIQASRGHCRVQIWKMCVKQSVLSVFNTSLRKGFPPTSVHSALLLWKHLGSLLPKIKLWTQVSHNNQQEYCQHGKQAVDIKELHFIPVRMGSSQGKLSGEKLETFRMEEHHVWALWVVVGLSGSRCQEISTWNLSRDSHWHPVRHPLFCPRVAAAQGPLERYYIFTPFS